MTEKTIAEELKEAIDAGSNSIVFSLPEDDYLNHLEEILDSLTDAGFKGIYVSFTRPYKDLKTRLEHNGIDISQLHVIDATTPAVTEVSDSDRTHCTFVSPEADIEDIADAIHDGLERLEATKRFILLDSITALALYQPESSAEHFTEYLTERLDLGPDTIYIINLPQASTADELGEEIKDDVDEVIEHHEH